MLLGPSCGAGFNTVTVLDREVALLFAGHEDKGNACVQMRSVGSLYCLGKFYLEGNAFWKFFPTLGGAFKHSFFSGSQTLCEPLLSGTYMYVLIHSDTYICCRCVCIWCMCVCVRTFVCICKLRPHHTVKPPSPSFSFRRGPTPCAK